MAASGSKTSSGKCGECDGKVGERDKAIECEICELWYHCKCVGMADDTYKVLSADKGVHWYCNGCERGVAKIFSALAKLTEKQDKMEKVLQGIGDKVDEVMNIKTEFVKMRTDFEVYRKQQTEEIKNVKEQQGVLKGRIDKNETQIINREEIEKLTKTCINDGVWSSDEKWSTIVGKEVEEKISGKMNDLNNLMESTKKQSEEMKQKEERRRNIILYNVPENKDLNSHAEQLDEDKQFVCDMLTYIIQDDIKTNEITRIIRLGFRDYQRHDEITRSRPVLVEFSEAMTKNLVMQNLGRLRNATSRFRNIVLNHDMTELERKECRDLVAEAKELEQKAAGEWIYRVRGLPGQMKIVRWKKH